MTVSRPPIFDDVKGVYAAQWASCTFVPSQEDAFRVAAASIMQYRTRYEAVAAATGVPWRMIAVIHLRESGLSFRGCLANGDPWDRATVHVPANKGPWASWEDAAIWSLRFQGLAGKPAGFWTIERQLYYTEQYNGWGYYYHDVPSAYLWAGTNIYHGGKYVADRVWDAKAWDQQLGAAGVLKALGVVNAAFPPTPSYPTPSTPPPSKKTWWELLMSLLGRK